MERVVRTELGTGGIFATTRWSVIAACSHPESRKANEALSELCQSYWQPVYACIRHHKHPVHEAQDLTQEFFVHLLKGKWLEHLDAAKGRFRSYLSVALRHFLISHHRRRWTLWRGGGGNVVPFDVFEAESQYKPYLSTQASPETLYERQWAATIIGQALAQLLIEMQADGKEALYGHFDTILSASSRQFAYEEVARMLGVTVQALHAALYRWRRRLQMLLREEVGRTVASTVEIDAELEHIRRLFSQAL